MKILAVAAYLLFGYGQNMVSTAGFGSTMTDRLEGFGWFALLVCLVFGYLCWRFEADRKWRRTRGAA